MTAVDQPAAQNVEILIGGPEAYSWNEILETTGQVSGHSLPVNYVKVGDPVPLLPEAMVQLLMGMESFESYIDMSKTSVRYGIEPTSLLTFAQQFFGKMVAAS